MYSARTMALAAVVLVAGCAVGCGERNSPTAPSKSAQLSVSAVPAASTSESGTLTTPDPPKGVAVPTVIGFPPRNEPNAFFQDLTALYRDFLRRPQTSSTYVDPEGENVWLTEYFRFYLNGCTHLEAVNRTLMEITLGGTQPVCGAETPDFPPRNLPNEFQTQLENTYRNVLRRSQILSYVDSEGANVWLAQYLRFRVSGCSHTDAENKVFTEIRGGGVQPACSGAATTTNGTVGAFGMMRHTFVVSGSGATNVRVRLTWSSGSIDLDLYATGTSCTNSNDPETCSPVLGVSQADTGTSEEFTINVQAGREFYVWVDNFTNSASSYTITTTIMPGFRGTDDVQLRVSPGAMACPAKLNSAHKFRSR